MVFSRRKFRGLELCARMERSLRPWEKAKPTPGSNGTAPPEGPPEPAPGRGLKPRARQRVPPSLPRSPAGAPASRDTGTSECGRLWSRRHAAGEPATRSGRAWRRRCLRQSLNKGPPHQGQEECAGDLSLVASETIHLPNLYPQSDAPGIARNNQPSAPHLCRTPPCHHSLNTPVFTSHLPHKPAAPQSVPLRGSATPRSANADPRFVSHSYTQSFRKSYCFYLQNAP